MKHRSRVYFVPVADGEPVDSVAQKTSRLASAARLDSAVALERDCAIKTHFGEGHNTGFVKPEIVAAIVQFVEKAGGRPFVTDTNTLYRGRRHRAVDHLRQAADHGFTLERIGAPVIIADGLLGADQVSVPIPAGKHFQQVRIASALHQAAAAIVLTHVKGHCQLGLGGSLKNVGMGCAARAGKLAQHQGGQPSFNGRKCEACGSCVSWCPTRAIRIEEHEGQRRAVVDPALCVGCGECLALCPSDAIEFSWSDEGGAIGEKVCEHVLGFHETKPLGVGYINMVTDLTRNCDCVGQKQRVEYPNVGVLASVDVVAVDQAAVDLSRKRLGKDIWSEWWPDAKFEAMLAYAESLGLGAREYDLVEV